MTKGSPGPFNPADWHKLGAWAEYAFSMEFWFGKSFGETYLRLYGGRPQALLYFDGKLNHQYFSRETVERCRARFQQSDAPDFFAQLKSELVDRRARLMRLKDEVEATDRPLAFASLLTEVYPLHTLNCVAAWSAFLYAQLFEEDASRAYGMLRGATAAQEFALLVTPTVESEPFLEQVELLREAVSVKGGKNIASAAAHLARRFGYLPVFQLGEPHEAVWYTETLQELLKKTTEALAQEEHQLVEARRKTLEDQQRLDSESALPEDLRCHLRSLRLCADLRTLNDESVSTVGTLQRRTLLPFAERWGNTVGDLFFLTVDELSRAVRDGSIPRETIAERRRFFVAYTTPNSTLEFVTGAPARALVAEFLRAETDEVGTDVRELKGLVAHPGHVRGRVRRVTQGSQAREFAEGEILVAQQTTVDFVPMMRRAAAIVTDHGGLTSHAAIVARELGKPCIVGTKIGTKVLKDGEEVEVDAGKGIVKILQKAV